MDTASAWKPHTALRSSPCTKPSCRACCWHLSFSLWTSCRSASRFCRSGLGENPFRGAVVLCLGYPVEKKQKQNHKQLLREKTFIPNVTKALGYRSFIQSTWLRRLVIWVLTRKNRNGLPKFPPFMWFSAQSFTLRKRLTDKTVSFLPARCISSRSA